MKNSHTLSACCKTDTGLLRSKNEDVCMANLENCCFLVADGMGGVSGGEVASGLFRETAAKIFSEGKTLSLRESREQVESCFSRANAEIFALANENPGLTGMGCTAELLTFHDDLFILGHVGDSRTYRFYDNKLEQITKDHSLIQHQLDRGEITSSQARKSKLKNIVLRAVGTNPMVTADIISGETLPATIFLLCSDGLHSMLTVEEICPVMAFDAPLDFKAEMLVNMANDAGGEDNITVTLVEVQ